MTQGIFSITFMRKDTVVTMETLKLAFIGIVGLVAITFALGLMVAYVEFLIVATEYIRSLKEGK